MKNLIYKELVLNYDYLLYSWVITSQEGSFIGKFTTLDKAKQFIDNLIE